MKYFYTIFFIIVTYIAAGSSAIRYFIYDIENHESKVSNYIKNNIDKDIKISSLKGHWQGHNPKISFKASIISNNKARANSCTTEFISDFDYIQPVIKYILVDGLNMTLNFLIIKMFFHYQAL